VTHTRLFSTKPHYHNHRQLEEGKPHLHRVMTYHSVSVDGKPKSVATFRLTNYGLKPATHQKDFFKRRGNWVSGDTSYYGLKNGQEVLKMRDKRKVVDGHLVRDIQFFSTKPHYRNHRQLESGTPHLHRVLKRQETYVDGKHVHTLRRNSQGRWVVGNPNKP